MAIFWSRVWPSPGCLTFFGIGSERKGTGITGAFYHVLIGMSYFSVASSLLLSAT